VPSARPVDPGWYDQLIQQTFNGRWVQPEGLVVGPASPLVAKLSVTIGRDGTVLHGRLVKPSGVAELDASVMRAAEAVKKIPQPLPKGLAGENYQIIINFQLN
jgi:TonB family protein